MVLSVLPEWYIPMQQEIARTSVCVPLVSRKNFGTLRKRLDDCEKSSKRVTSCLLQTGDRGSWDELRTDQIICKSTKKVVNSAQNKGDCIVKNNTEQSNKYFYTRFVYSKRVNRQDVHGLMVHPLKVIGNIFRSFINNYIYI